MSEIDDLQNELNRIDWKGLPTEMLESLSAVADGIQAEIDAHRSAPLEARATIAGIRNAIFWLRTAVDLARLHRTIEKKAAEWQKQLKETLEETVRQDVERAEQMVSESKALIDSLTRQAALAANRMPSEPEPDDEASPGLRM
ncbi:hypothetical protein [Xanthomonas citri]|uniref:hypothetical protein n=1 Tax=Xanthomonas citri TaxID=346 RepID=UPI000536FEE8|nr:hypothetical protein [Xanthomonas citri]KGU41860.1 hypothetical protein NY95_12225 [Xanthomonas citri pv. fuscans]SOO08825.1 hypothetical protein XFF6970_290063 [Xanthomonas citri pv. fuscans]